MIVQAISGCGVSGLIELKEHRLRGFHDPSQLLTRKKNERAAVNAVRKVADAFENENCKCLMDSWQWVYLLELFFLVYFHWMSIIFTYVMYHTYRMK